MLESRWLPAPWTGSLAGVVSGGATAVGYVAPASPAGSSSGKGMTAAAPPAEIDVTVGMNAPDSVYDLSKVLSAWEGWQYHDPPRISIARNTNRALVTARLTGTELRLSYAAGQSGTANVTVGLTDAAGASIEVTFVITVQPGLPVTAAKVQPLKLPSAPSPLRD
jgi:hypothetical protein